MTDLEARRLNEAERKREAAEEKMKKISSELEAYKNVVTVVGVIYTSAMTGIGIAVYEGFKHNRPTEGIARMVGTMAIITIIMVGISIGLLRKDATMLVGLRFFFAKCTLYAVYMQWVFAYGWWYFEKKKPRAVFIILMIVIPTVLLIIYYLLKAVWISVVLLIIMSKRSLAGTAS